MRLSPTFRRRTLCLGLALVGHLWLLRSGYPPTRWPVGAPSAPLDVHLVTRAEPAAAIAPLSHADEAGPRPSTQAGRRTRLAAPTTSKPSHDDVPRAVVDPGRAGAVAPPEAPLAVPEGTSTRRMLADLDRQQDKLSRTRDRLEFPVHDEGGADRLGRAINAAARAECADTLRHPSIVGLLSMARDTVRNQGCRW